jgi:hypothetical protein
MAKYFTSLLLAVFVCLFSCQRNTDATGSIKDYEFVKVDSLVFDELETMTILDYHHEKELYLMVNKGTEGRYVLVDKAGNKVAENYLSEGPDSFGLVLHRGGFVGDEIMFVSDQTIFMYDQDLKPLRKFPFKQEARVKLIHWSLDYLSTYTHEGQVKAIANLGDSFLQPYPMDYYDTLNAIHLVDPIHGSVTKGGKLDTSSRLTQGRFLPFMDKPVFFSDAGSAFVSVIYSGDSILYQFDPNRDFAVESKIKIDRLAPDDILDIPMSEASFASVREHRPRNVQLGGAFQNMLGRGDSFILEYQTGADPAVYKQTTDREELELIRKSKNLYYYPFENSKQVGPPVLWDKPGKLIFNVGGNRYLQYGDPAEIHDWEKDYQCYYIYELREKTI